MMEIKAKRRGEANGITVQYNTPQTLQDFVDRFGIEHTFDMALKSLVINLQNIARLHMDEGAEKVQALVDSWVPGTRISGPKKTPLEKATSVLADMSAEDLQTLLEKVRAAKKAS